MALKFFTWNNSPDCWACEAAAYEQLRQYLTTVQVKPLHETQTTPYAHSPGRLLQGQTDSSVLLLRESIGNALAHHKDLFGKPLPPCIVMEHGTPLSSRTAEGRLDFFEVLKVCRPTFLAVWRLALVATSLLDLPVLHERKHASEHMSAQVE